MPTFKKIVSVTDMNSRMLDKTFSVLRVVYTNILAEVAEMCSKRTGGESSGTRKCFQSSNIALDFSRSNKHICPMGEREN
jgi:hypothetical protein